VGSICWVAYSFWDYFWLLEEDELACWRWFLRVEERAPCVMNGPVMAKDAFWIFGPPLLAGIAILTVAWIVTGFQRRA